MSDFSSMKFQRISIAFIMPKKISFDRYGPVWKICQLKKLVTGMFLNNFFWTCGEYICWLLLLTQNNQRNLKVCHFSHWQLFPLALQCQRWSAAYFQTLNYPLYPAIFQNPYNFIPPYSQLPFMWTWSNNSHHFHIFCLINKTKWSLLQLRYTTPISRIFQ